MPLLGSRAQLFSHASPRWPITLCVSSRMVDLVGPCLVLLGCPSDVCMCGSFDLVACCSNNVWYLFGSPCYDLFAKSGLVFGFHYNFHCPALHVDVDPLPYVSDSIRSVQPVHRVSRLLPQTQNLAGIWRGHSFHWSPAQAGRLWAA